MVCSKHIGPLYCRLVRVFGDESARLQRSQTQFRYQYLFTYLFIYLLTSLHCVSAVVLHSLQSEIKLAVERLRT